MDMPLSERRQIENEMIFRRVNEKVVNELDELDAQLIKDDYPELTITDDDMVLHFVCECSDENCIERIPVKLSKYQKLHKNRKVFILKHGHEVKEIEEIIHTKNKYIVVEKNKTVGAPGNKLNTTSVDNT